MALGFVFFETMKRVESQFVWELNLPLFWYKNVSEIACNFANHYYFTDHVKYKNRR